MAESIIRDTQDEPADHGARRGLVFDAAAQIEAINSMLLRELDVNHSEYERYLLPQMLRRVHALRSVILSVTGGDDDRKTEEMCDVIHG